MSFCRFSTNDYTSDVYCYEGGNGFVTHVAGCRVIYDEPLPAPIKFTTENLEAWFVRHNKVNQMVERAEKVPIGLGQDGECFCDSDAKSCMDRLLWLRSLGYNVPQSAIDCLSEEIGVNVHIE